MPTKRFPWSTLLILIAASPFWIPQFAMAQGFEKINTTLNNVVALLVSISLAVVTIAIFWVAYKMVYHAARLADVANVLFGAALMGGAGAIAAYLVSA